jgi:hypothetical protein
VSTIIDARLLERWRALTNRVPKASMSGFLAAVAAEGKPYGVPVRVTCRASHVPCVLSAALTHTCLQSRDIDQAAFQRCYTEYRLAEAAVNEQIAGVHVLECAACGPQPLAMHVDGNHKLFCWSHHQDHSRAPLTTGILFHPDSEVQEHVHAINAVSQSKQQVRAELSHLRMRHALSKCLVPVAGGRDLWGLLARRSPGRQQQQQQQLWPRWWRQHGHRPWQRQQRRQQHNTQELHGSCLR